MFPARQIRTVVACVLLGALASLVPAQTDQAAATAQYRVAGRVVSSVDGHPLARARITLAEVKNSRKPLSMLSGEDGSFVFTALAAGKYSLQGAMRGYPMQGYEQHDFFSSAIATGAGLDTEHLTLRLVPYAYISGRVLDENGDPVRHANVRLYRIVREDGSGRIYPNRAAMTDDLGAFEIGPNRPGTYFLMAKADPWYAVHARTQPPGLPDGTPLQIDPALDVAYPTTYYNDITDPEAATPIQIRGGERLQVDVHLAPVHSLHFLVHVPEGSFPQLLESGLDGDSSNVPVNVQPIAPGLWELSGVPEGKFKMHVNGEKGIEKGMQISDILATSQTQEIDVSNVQPPATVDIAAEVVGENGLPPQLTIGLRVPGGMLRSSDMVDRKGVAHLKNVPAGRYEVMGWTNTRGPYPVSRIAVSGADLSGRTIDVRAGAKVDAAVIFVQGRATVEGVAVRKGKALAGAMIVLVPDKPEDHADLFRRDQSDLDGTFAVSGVVPGNYTLVAIENGWDLEWSRPEVIGAYVKKGLPIRIPEGSTAAMKASAPVEVQTR